MRTALTHREAGEGSSTGRSWWWSYANTGFGLTSGLTGHVTGARSMFADSSTGDVGVHRAMETFELLLAQAASPCREALPPDLATREVATH